MTGLSIIKKNKAGKKRKKVQLRTESTSVSVRWKKKKEDEEAPAPFNKFSQFKPPNFYVKKSSCFASGCYNGCFRYNLTAVGRQQGSVEGGTGARLNFWDPDFLADLW